MQMRSVQVNVDGDVIEICQDNDTGDVDRILITPEQADLFCEFIHRAKQDIYSERAE